jgi:UDPglucose 6-dehydrogenase
LADGGLSFTGCHDEAVRRSDAIFVAVGTPPRHNHGHADLSFLNQAVLEIAPFLTGYTIIVVKSTVPVGTGEEVERIIRSLRPDADLDDERAKDVMMTIYRPLQIKQVPVVVTSRRTGHGIFYTGLGRGIQLNLTSRMAAQAIA